MKRSVANQGFTIVEVLVVLIVIGILLATVTTFYVVHQRDTRNTTRQTRTTLIAGALEEYYDNKGEYPGCTAITAATVATTLGTTDPNIYKTPTASSTDNQLRCLDISTTTEDVYAYKGTCPTTGYCTSWTLSYREEGSGAIKTITSRR